MADVQTFDGRRLSVAVAGETLFDTTNSIRTGRLVRSRLIDIDDGRVLTNGKRANLLGSDMERADLLALKRARRLAFGGGAGLLIIHVSFVTASSQRARPGLAEAAAPFRAAGDVSLIWLMTDIPEGASGARLGEAVAFLRAQGRAVFGEVRSASMAKGLKAAGISGLALAAPSDKLSETDSALWLLHAGRGFEGSPPQPRIAAGLCSPSLTGMAGAAGFTHVGVVDS